MATTETLHFDTAHAARALYANDDRNLKTLETELGVRATARDGWIKLEGEPTDVERARRLLLALQRQLQEGTGARPREFSYALNVVKNEGVEALKQLFEHPELSKQLIFKGGTSLSKVYGLRDC